MQDEPGVQTESDLPALMAESARKALKREWNSAPTGEFVPLWTMRRRLTLRERLSPTRWLVALLYWLAFNLEDWGRWAGDKAWDVAQRLER